MNKQELFSLQHEGICAYNKKQFNQALEIFQQYLSHLPNDPMAYFNLCVVLEELRRWDEAKTAIENSLRLDPCRSYFYHHLAFIYANQGQFEQARQHFHQAVTIDPDYINAHYNLGVMYELLDEKDKAMAEFKICIELDPEYIFAHNHLAVLYMDLENWDEAKKEIDTGLSLCAEDPVIHATLAAFYARQKIFDQAFEAIQQTLDICPDNPVYIFNKADILYQMQDYNKAKELCLEIIQKDSNYLPALVLLGKYYQKYKNSTIAHEYYQKALSLNPELKDSDEAIKEFYSKIFPLNTFNRNSIDKTEDSNG